MCWISANILAQFMKDGRTKHFISHKAWAIDPNFDTSKTLASKLAAK